MDKRVVSIVPGAQELLKRAKLAAKTQPEDPSAAELMATAPYYSGYGSSASDAPQSGEPAAPEPSATAVKLAGPDAPPALHGSPGFAHVLSSSTEEFSKYVRVAGNDPRRAASVAMGASVKPAASCVAAMRRCLGTEL